MTGVAVRGCSFITIGVAGLALNARVPTLERKASVVVVEGGICPICGFMAGATIGAKLTVVFILAGMTGVTIGGCTLESLRVAGLAVNTRM